jgi:monoamine oxidase
VRSPYPAVPPFPTDTQLAQTLLQALELDPLVREVPVAQPWRARRAAEFDRQTLEDWKRANVTSAGGQRAFDSVVRGIWGADPREMSLLYALAYTAGAGNAGTPGSFARLITTPNGAQEQRFAGGSQLISERVAGRLGRRVVARRTGAADRPGQRRRARRRERRHGSREARDRLPAARPRARHRLLARAAARQAPHAPRVVMDDRTGVNDRNVGHHVAQ